MLKFSKRITETAKKECRILTVHKIGYMIEMQSKDMTLLIVLLWFNIVNEVFKE